MTEWQAPNRHETLWEALPHALNLGKYGATRAKDAAYIAKHQEHERIVQELCNLAAEMMADAIELLELAWKWSEREEDNETLRREMRPEEVR